MVRSPAPSCLTPPCQARRLYSKIQARRRGAAWRLRIRTVSLPNCCVRKLRGGTLLRALVPSWDSALPRLASKPAFAAVDQRGSRAQGLGLVSGQGLRNSLTASTPAQGPVNMQGISCPGPFTVELYCQEIRARKSQSRHATVHLQVEARHPHPRYLNSAHQSPPFPERVADLSPRPLRQPRQKTPIHTYIHTYSCLTRTGVLPRVLDVTRQPAPGDLAGCYDVGASIPRRTRSSVHLGHWPPLANTRSPMWRPGASINVPPPRSPSRRIRGVAPSARR